MLEQLFDTQRLNGKPERIASSVPNPKPFFSALRPRTLRDSSWHYHSDSCHLAVMLTPYASMSHQGLRLSHLQTASQLKADQLLPLTERIYPAPPFEQVEQFEIEQEVCNRTLGSRLMPAIAGPWSWRST
jgi:hypothetical protein